MSIPVALEAIAWIVLPLLQKEFCECWVTALDLGARRKLVIGEVKAPTERSRQVDQFAEGIRRAFNPVGVMLG